MLANYLATRDRGFGPEVKRRIMLGTYALSAGYYDAYYLKAQKVRTLIKSDFDRAFEQVDALVAPTSPTVAFPLGARLDDPVAMYLIDACTLPVSVAGLPGMSVPCGLADGLPVGLQLIGRAWDELRLTTIARGYEAVTATADWRALEPSDLGRASDPSTPAPSCRQADLQGPRAHSGPLDRPTGESKRPLNDRMAQAPRSRAGCHGLTTVKRPTRESKQ